MSCEDCVISPGLVCIRGCVFVCARRVWDPTKRSTTAHTELTSPLLSLDWVPQSEKLVSRGREDCTDMYIHV